METYGTAEWLRRRALSQIGDALEQAAGFIPLPMAARFRQVGAIKSFLAGSAQVFPDRPAFEQLGAIPRQTGRAFDLLEADVRAGSALAVPQDVAAVLFSFVLPRGAAGQGNVVVMPPFFGSDP